MAASLAVLCGVTAGVFMSIKHLFIRLYKANYSGLDMGVDATMFEFAICCFFWFPLSSTDFRPDLTQVIIGIIAGCLMSLARVFISVAVSIGLAAPANSLMTTHSIHQSCWSAAIGGQTLSPLQILGLIFGLVGVFSISYFDHLAS